MTDYETDYKLALSVDEIREYLNGAEIVSFDFETSPLDDYRNEPNAALDAHKSSITGVSLSVSKGTGVYVPLRHKVGHNANVGDVMEYLRKSVFESKSVTAVAHNLAFESQHLYALGIVVQQPCYDTIAAAQLTLKNDFEFRGLSDSGLKTLVPYLYKVELPKYEEVVGGRHFDELNSADPETIRYACADSDFGRRLYFTFNKWFDENLPKHRWLVENVESPAAVYTGIMKYNGVGVDTDLMRSKQAEADEKIAELRSQIQEIIGDVDLGANASTNAFKNYLYKDLGLPVLKTTEKYQEAADDEALQLLIAYCKENRPNLVLMLELTQEYRKWGKIKSTYIDGYLQHINSATGRIHCDLLPLGTDTGRYAARKPNLQNMHRKGNDPIGVRNFFVAAKGSSFLDFDFSQIELRVGAFYCQDEKMLETYKTGGDIHAQTTSVIYGVDAKTAEDKSDPNYKERRTIAKNCNFGVFFGLYPNGLQRTLKFKAGVEKSKAECFEIIDNLKNGYPKLKEWQAIAVKMAKSNGYSETYLGRRRYLKGITSFDFGVRSFNERCALNTPIQGTAADILKLAMGRFLKVIKEMPFIKPLLQVHDELLFEIEDRYVDRAAAIIKTVMETNPFAEFTLPIVAEGASGKCFGELNEM